MSRGYVVGPDDSDILDDNDERWSNLVLIECDCGFVGTPEPGAMFGTGLYCPDCKRNTAHVVYTEREAVEVPSGLMFDDE